jgi:predicted DCC family thiol-disulfide oxidoreductase YuxK
MTGERVTTRHLVLFDGACGLCVRVNQFILARDRTASVDFASLQSDTGRAMAQRFGRNPDALTTFFVVVNYRHREATLLDRSDAALFVAGLLTRPWRLLRGLRFLPRRLRDRAYDVVARYRYRFFGSSDVCAIPDPATAARFIDGSAAPLRRNV